MILLEIKPTHWHYAASISLYAEKKYPNCKIHYPGDGQSDLNIANDCIICPDKITMTKILFDEFINARCQIKVHHD